MNKFLPATFFIVLSCSVLQAQERKPDGGGSYEHSKAACLSPQQHEEIERMIGENRKMLIAKGILPAPGTAAKTTAVMFNWPLKNAAGHNYYSSYGISNFVDHNQNYPNLIQDWNCGTRSYDLSSGYNHAGMDIFLWPFDINLMEASKVEIVAAAAGTIVGKYDGNPDHNCAMGSGSWNAVYVQHSDGTMAWYGHMKTGSLTSKIVGASVAQGEFLGNVGSSGSSTGPHLHFEVHDAQSNILDPYHGNCNSPATMWNTQKPYHESAINTVLTHNAAPVFNPCPATHTMNLKDTFLGGQKVYYAAYYHDQESGQNGVYTVYRPDNSVYQTWTHASPAAYYSASWWYWYYTLPSNASYGKWKFQVVYQGNTYTHDFWVIDPTTDVSSVQDPELIRLFPNPAKDFLELNIAADQASIYNELGQRVLSQDMKGADRIDVRALPDGMYFVCLLQDGKLLRSKFLIAR